MKNDGKIVLVLAGGALFFIMVALAQEETIVAHLISIATIIALVVAYYKLYGRQSQLEAEAENAQREKVKEIAVARATAQADLERFKQEQLKWAQGVHQACLKIVERLKKDSLKFLSDKLTPSNFSSTKDKYAKLIEFLEKNGFKQDKAAVAEVMQEFKAAYEDVVRKEAARQEQARIKAQIREEARLEAERQREMQRIENEELAIQTALQKALQRTKDEHDTEVERLRQKLAEAQARLERAKSQAQLTKAGHVYVISNIGSFGENVFKIGMTRRLEPMDRIKELGDASVPFPFDVHMMISCNDAPALESALHREFHKIRLNKVNLQKEFFRVDIETIRKLVEKNHGRVDYVAEPEALQYRESLSMTDEDFEFVSKELEQFAMASEDGE